MTTQKTISKEVAFSGVGLHTGVMASVTLKPGAENTGVVFYKKGTLIGSLGNSFVEPDSVRCSAIGHGDLRILTVEHFLAALFGLGVTNIVVDVDGPEMPALDGSALVFSQKIQEAGVLTQNSGRMVYSVTEPLFCHEDKKAIAIYPSNDFRISYVLDYGYSWLSDQKIDFVFSPENFVSQIAPARTFCTVHEADALKKAGLGLGATYENNLVMSENGPIQNKLRFEDECARHKVLDILGDLSLMGFAVKGHVVAVRSGHSLNRKLADAIKKQKEKTMTTAKTPVKASSYVMDSEQIKSILPHRYPFLLVDRIIEMSDKRIVGIKNLTVTEQFFQGHFPGKPVMPGVLMIEALAQVGGVLMLSKTENRGKLAYLVAVNDARFRRLVIPGDTLILEVDILKFKSRVGIVKCKARVGDEVACEAEIMFTLGE